MYKLEDKDVIFLSLLVFSFGIIFVFISSSFKPDLVEIQDIDYDFIGDFVSVCGFVDSYSLTKDGHFFAVFSDINNISNKILVVFFKDIAKSKEVSLFLDTSDIVCISGSVDIYNSVFEIISDDIWFFEN
ncbi:MAG: hypothetical protein K0B02_00425 [DPANN group archaeon]|nr:hypothetical protein [DPANN group archaeon]